MTTTTIRIRVRSLDAAWDRRRLADVLGEIEAALREDANTPVTLTADSMTIAIEVATERLPAAAVLLRHLGLI